MPYQINDHELRAVTALPASARLDHFVKRVCDWRTLWVLRVNCADDKSPRMRVWPHPAYVVNPTSSDLSDVSLENFMQELRESSSAADAFIEVFPTSAAAGALVSASELGAALRAELDEWYGEQD